MALLFKNFLLALTELYLLSATAQITTILKFILTLVEHGVDRDKIATFMALLFKNFLLALTELYLLSATAQITTILKFILTLVEHGVDRDKIATCKVKGYPHLEKFHLADLLLIL